MSNIMQTPSSIEILVQNLLDSHCAHEVKYLRLQFVAKDFDPETSDGVRVAEMLDEEFAGIADVRRMLDAIGVDYEITVESDGSCDMAAAYAKVKDV